MNKQEFDKRVDAAIGKLVKTMTEEYEKEPQPYKRWRAGKGEGFYGCSLNEVVCKTDNGSEDCDNAYRSGNYFEYEHEAQDYYDKCMAVAEVKLLAEGHVYTNEGENSSHYITYSHNDSDFHIASVWDCQGMTVYFATCEKAQHAIDTLGEEKLKLIFNIK